MWPTAEDIGYELFCSIAAIHKNHGDFSDEALTFKISAVCSCASANKQLLEVGDGGQKASNSIYGDYEEYRIPALSRAATPTLTSEDENQSNATQNQTFKYSSAPRKRSLITNDTPDRLYRTALLTKIDLLEFYKYLPRNTNPK